MSREPRVPAKPLAREPFTPDLVDIIAAATSTPDRQIAPGSDSGRPAGRPSDLHPRPDLGAAALVGFCLDDTHPTLAGRVLVRFTDGAGEREVWMATLARLPVRREDRVLLLQPVNWPEPLVVGVIDGLRARTVPTAVAASLTLKADEALEIRDPDGAPLLSIVPAPGGPVLRLASADQRLEVAGRLAFAAEAIDFAAQGGVTLSAGGDVVVNGEEIKLN